MYAWGVGKHGQTGLGSKEDQTRPASINSPLENIVSLAVGPRMNLALTSEGDLYSWGTGLMGELGLAYITRQETPAKLAKVSVKFKSIAVGYEHCLAISEGGDLYVWGANDLGQLGTGDLKPIDRPTKLKLGHKFIAVAAGTKHSMALNEHGFLFTWGAGWAGQQGDNASQSFLAPRMVTEDLTFKYISAGDYCSLAITNRGKVYTWGSGSHGRLGHGDVKPQLAPKIIDHLTKMNVTAVKVIAGYDHMLLLSDKGELWSWGAGANGETAQNTTVRRMIPHPVLFETPAQQAAEVSPASETAVANGDSTETGSTATPSIDTDGNANASSSTTTEASSGTPRDAISAATETVSNGRASRISSSATAAQPENPGPFVDIGTGLNFSVAITRTGECYTWGNGRNGVLGNGTKEGIVRVATKVDSQVSFTKIFVSKDHIIALGSGEGAPIVLSPPETTDSDSNAQAATDAPPTQ